ncbi:MAG: PKD domain-containing protein [Solirubrobacterales bacterium]|nr:PKD domain-containing protein [Solirubrobacterales bacterium]
MSFSWFPDKPQESSPGPPGPRGGRRSGVLLARILLGALVVALLAGFSAASRASAAGGEVKVDFRGDSIPIRLDELGPPDIPDSSYKLDSGWAVYSGYSLRSLLETASRSAGFQMVSVVSVEIDARPGTRTIARSQIDNGPPIFFGEDGGTSWILPGSAGQPGQLFSFRDSAPVIRVDYGIEFQIGLSASPVTARAGDEVEFKATVSGHPQGDSLTFTWNFGDGSVREEASGRVSHEYKSQGSYQVELEVTGPSGGGSAEVTVQVGKEKRPEGEKGLGDGDKNEDGKKDGKKDGGSAGAGEGKGSGTGTGTGAGSGSGAGTGTGTGSGTGTGTGLAASAGPTDTSSGTSASGPASEVRELPDLEQTEQRQGDQGLVRGFVVDPDEIATAPAVTEPTLVKPDPGGSGIAKAALSATGILILLALGSLTERLVFRRA